MKRLLLIDANSLVYRSYFALPPFTGPDNEPTGAIYGLSSILLKIFRENKPDYAAAAYDRPEPTFRKKEFKEYKITRPPAPNDLIRQLQESQILFKLFGIRSFEAPGFEADDIIATLARKFEDENELRIVILSGDLDSLQLVKTDRVVVWVPQKGVSNLAVYDEQAVLKRFGVGPGQMPDYKGLVGDKSDNIPGVSGIGPKTATAIIREFGCLEDFYGLSPSPKTPVFKKLIEGQERAILSKQLAKLCFDVPLEISGLRELKLEEPDTRKLARYFEDKGFKSLVSRLESDKIKKIESGF
jgi:DNA polymerase-1